jgi:phosphoenolpyruvate carboxylase
MKQATKETPVALAPKAPARASKTDKRDSERPLVEDIRLLGRILGDVIRTQEGPEAYELTTRPTKRSRSCSKGCLATAL